MRIGVNAPKNVAVHREEIFERIKAERSQAGNACTACDRHAVVQTANGVWSYGVPTWAPCRAKWEFDPK